MQFSMWLGGVCGLLCLLAVVPCGVAEQRPFSGKLCLRDADGRTLYSVPLAEGREFGIRFIHSVAKSPVEEWFRVENGVLHLKRTVYQDFGAGLPFQPGPGQKMTFSGGRITLEGFDTPLPCFDVRVGRIAHHALLLPDGANYRNVPLADVSPPGTAVTFSLENACDQ